MTYITYLYFICYMFFFINEKKNFYETQSLFRNKRIPLVKKKKKFNNINSQTLVKKYSFGLKKLINSVNK